MYTHICFQIEHIKFRVKKHIIDSSQKSKHRDTGSDYNFFWTFYFAFEMNQIERSKMSVVGWFFVSFILSFDLQRWQTRKMKEKKDEKDRRKKNIQLILQWKINNKFIE